MIKTNLAHQRPFNKERNLHEPQNIKLIKTQYDEKSFYFLGNINLVCHGLCSKTNRTCRYR